VSGAGDLVFTVSVNLHSSSRLLCQLAHWHTSMTTLIAVFQKRFSASWQAWTPLPWKRVRSPCRDESMQKVADVEPQQSDDTLRHMPVSKETDSVLRGLRSLCPDEQDSSREYSAAVNEKCILHNSSTCAMSHCFYYSAMTGWVSSFLTAHQHIIGYFSALQWCEYRDKIVEISQRMQRVTWCRFSLKGCTIISYCCRCHWYVRK